jgi:hypothetical protein
VHLENISVLKGYMSNHVNTHPNRTNWTYPIFGFHRMIFIYVAAERDNIKIVRTERASKLFPELFFSIYLFKP